MLNSFKKDYSKYKDSADAVILAAESSGKYEFTYEEICNGYKEMKKEKESENKKERIVPLIYLASNGFSQDFIKFVREKYGVVLNPVKKNEDSESIIKASAVDIRIFKNYENPLDSSVYYFVGNKNLKDAKVEKAFHIRGLWPLNDDNTLIHKLLDQLNVDFVRLGEFTVYPFANKYLTEYMNLSKCSNNH